MTKPAHLFDIESAEGLYKLLAPAAKTFLAAPAKRTEDLLFLIFGLTHLREWIAPNYSAECPPRTPEERFSDELNRLTSYQLLKDLCNRSKHMRKQVAMGPLRRKAETVAYFVEGRDVDDVLRDVLTHYETKWFSRANRRSDK